MKKSNIKYLKDFTYKDISDYANYLWQETTQGMTVIALLEFFKDAPKIRRFHKIKDTIKREKWWQEHKFELLDADNLNKKINLETYEVVG